MSGSNLPAADAGAACDRPPGRGHPGGHGPPPSDAGGDGHRRQAWPECVASGFEPELMPSRQRNNAREDILRVFAEMVARNGYAETSIGDVAAALGLSKGTVVYHFN